jgi:hypothetical protein
MMALKRKDVCGFTGKTMPKSALAQMSTAFWPAIFS